MHNGRNHVTSVLHDLEPHFCSDVEVVECTRILGPNTPLSQLAPPFKNTPQVEIHKILRYDDGPVCLELAEAMEIPVPTLMPLNTGLRARICRQRHRYTGCAKVVAPVNATTSVRNLTISAHQHIPVQTGRGLWF